MSESSYKVDLMSLSISKGGMRMSESLLISDMRCYSPLSKSAHLNEYESRFPEPFRSEICPTQRARIDITEWGDFVTQPVSDNA